MSEDLPCIGALRVWYSAKEDTKIFYLDVEDVKIGFNILNAFALYDAHLESEKIRDVDYENNGGLQIYTDQGWIDWNDYADAANLMAEFEMVSESVH